MNMVFEPDPVPLRQDEQGAVRVGKTRVLLELVVRAFQDGATPETIVRDYYPSLALPDVYAVIAWYLRHRGEVEDYLRQREEQAEATRRLIEAGQPPRPGKKAELLARVAAREGDASSSG